MNLPNKLTLLRVAMVPLCLALLALNQPVACAVCFAAACLTDTLDGYLARKNNLVTAFGKFADPIADKALTLTLMILMAAKGLLPVWLPLIVCVRELMVDGLRLVAMEQGTVLAAALAGKIKTVLQMVLILCALVFPQGDWVLWGAAAVAAVTLWSGWEYFRQAGPALWKDKQNPTT